MKDLQTVLGHSQTVASEELVEIFPEPVPHPVVDDGVDRTVGHGEPVEAKVDMLDVGEGHDGGLVVGVDEVDVVGEPADPEDRDDDHKHLNYFPLVLPALHRALSQLPGGVSPQILS